MQDQLRTVPGVTVIIYDQRCAAEARRLRKRGLLAEPPRRVVINEAVCEGCGDCSTKSNCLSVLPLETEFGEKRQHPRPVLQPRLHLPRGRLPLVRDSRSEADGPEAEARRTAEASVRHRAARAVRCRCRRFRLSIGSTASTSPESAAPAWSPPTGSWPPAAEAAGFVVGGMDQTGLSQKAGAVVSHLHLATDTVDPGLGHDRARGCRPVPVGRHPAGRRTATSRQGEPRSDDRGRRRRLHPHRGHAADRRAAPDVAVLERAISDRVGRDRVFFLDSKRMAEVLFGDHLLANVVLLGAACQLGGLPLPLDKIESAIQGQRGVDVDQTWQAFEWGRWAVHDPAAVGARLEDVTDGGSGRTGIFDPTSGALDQAAGLVAARRLPDELRPLLLRRTAQVIDYQDPAYGSRFLGLVANVVRHDGAANGWALTRAVAESWFKLLTYKDEYEVARLHLKADYRRIAADLGIGGSYSLHYHLHPPILRQIGLQKKLPMGKPYGVAFHALRRMKRLRGTSLDVFGWHRDRRMERAVIVEYQRLVEEMLESASAVTYEAQVRIAESALAIKGYGPIKEAAIGRWRQTVRELLLDSGLAAATA